MTGCASATSWRPLVATMTTSELDRRILFAGLMVLGPGHVGLAQAEVRAAIERHPDKAEALVNATRLLKPTHERMRDGAEFVYRGHVRELLERVAAGEDTRPGTAAEVVLVCSDTSKLAPFTTAAAGLQGRMWELAFPDQQIWADGERQKHYEGLKSSEIDSLERTTRDKIAQRWRT